MKAAVIIAPGEMPRYTDIAEPVAQDGEILVSVKAVALKHLDRSRSNGTHYSSEGNFTGARVAGGDGICLLPDGTRVYAIGASGMMAEKATVERDRIVPVPEGLDDITAAALPNGVFGSAMALRFRAGIAPGDTVLVNGATGFTGRMAVQLARYYGAGRVIATGRNVAALEELRGLGVDETLSTRLSDEEFVAQFRRMHRSTPVQVIIDYLWGHTAELLLTALNGDGSFSPRTRFVSVGAMTGDTIRLSSALLRSVDLQLSGSGLGSWTRGQVRTLLSEMLPEMFQLAADGKLRVGTTVVPLAEIANLWDMDISDGKRLVVRIADQVLAAGASARNFR
ncbi:MAG TPA: zinc-binding dehydrogenase [Puia sp.]|uniref:quinone oxidoreductase family protein n=1 Tax=Puia sp. TaxID=2045100 RepID=UPI002D015BC5|nr:zinc-binding dehydrogenase [Puia sp.]HVU99646.1 zinc-binding dehydrogenase [Puia sp.]